MSLYRRKDSSVFWLKFPDPTRPGKYLQESTGTADRRAAQEYHDRRKAELWAQSRLGVKPPYPWQAAAVRWIEDHRHKASLKTDRVHLRELDQYLGASCLQDITSETLARIVRGYQARGLANASINRALALIRAILNEALKKWQVLDAVPHVAMLYEPKRRIRWLTPRQAEVLLAHLPEHLAAMARFSLETGLRAANVTGLRWSQVNLARKTAWVHPDQAKARKAIAVPLSDVAVAVLQQQAGRHPDYVFTYRGAPVRQVSTRAWKKALRRAEIHDFRWHDLRHTWASWHVQRGTPLQVLQELGGWESVEMVRRYAHLSSEHLAEYARSMTAIETPAATISLRSDGERGESIL